MAIEKMYVTYFMHIDFIQISSFNHWIEFKMSFEFQNVLVHILKLFFLRLGFPKIAIKISIYYTPIILTMHHFLGEKWWKVAQP